MEEITTGEMAIAGVAVRHEMVTDIDVGLQVAGTGIVPDPRITKRVAAPQRKRGEVTPLSPGAPPKLRNLPASPRPIPLQPLAPASLKCTRWRVSDSVLAEEPLLGPSKI